MSTIDWSVPENRYREMLAWRGVAPDDACSSCGGSGVQTYGSTATWRGGIGGQAHTTDICDQCWGTGSASRKGVDLRRLREPVVPVARLRQLVEKWRTKESVPASEGYSSTAWMAAARRNDLRAHLADDLEALIREVSGE